MSYKERHLEVLFAWTPFRLYVNIGWCQAIIWTSAGLLLIELLWKIIN